MADDREIVVDRPNYTAISLDSREARLDKDLTGIIHVLIKYNYRLTGATPKIGRTPGDINCI